MQRKIIAAARAQGLARRHDETLSKNLSQQPARSQPNNQKQLIRGDCNSSVIVVRGPACTVQMQAGTPHHNNSTTTVRRMPKLRIQCCSTPKAFRSEAQGWNVYVPNLGKKSARCPSTPTELRPIAKRFGDKDSLINPSPIDASETLTFQLQTAHSAALWCRLPACKFPMPHHQSAGQ